MTYDKEEILNDLTEAFENVVSFSSIDCDSVYDIIERRVGRQKYTYDYGATKFVLIPLDKKKDYVIKIPFTGEWDEFEDEYTEFCNSNDRERPWDYCGGEAWRYKIASEFGLEDYFAETKLIGFINEYPIYVQERCVTFWESTGRVYSDQEKQTTRNILAGFSERISVEWSTDFRLYFGANALVDFIDFLAENAWDDDLRYHNIGYIGDRPVLIDYSGYYE